MSNKGMKAKARVKSGPMAGLTQEQIDIENARVARNRAELNIRVAKRNKREQSFRTQMDDQKLDLDERVLANRLFGVLMRESGVRKGVNPRYTIDGQRLIASAIFNYAKKHDLTIGEVIDGLGKKGGSKYLVSIPDIQKKPDVYNWNEDAINYALVAQDETTFKHATNAMRLAALLAKGKLKPLTTATNFKHLDAGTTWNGMTEVPYNYGTDITVPTARQLRLYTDDNDVFANRWGGNLRNHDRPIYFFRDGGGKITGYGTTASIVVPGVGRQTGQFVVIPTIANGKLLTKKEATSRYESTGEFWGAAKNDKEAENLAQNVHQFHQKTYGPIWNAYVESHPDELSDKLKEEIEMSKKAEAKRQKGAETRQAAKGGESEPSDEMTESADSVNGEPATDIPVTGSPRIVINPSTFRNKKDAMCVAWNERFRIAMEQYGWEPQSEPTPKQRKFFADTAYADDEVQLRRTIIARILTLDTSVKDPTDEQLAEAGEFLQAFKEREQPSNDWEAAAVDRIAELVAAVKPSGLSPAAPRTEGSTHAAVGGGAALNPFVPADALVMSASPAASREPNLSTPTTNYDILQARRRAEMPRGPTIYKSQRVDDASSPSGTAAQGLSINWPQAQALQGQVNWPQAQTSQGSVGNQQEGTTLSTPSGVGQSASNEFNRVDEPVYKSIYDYRKEHAEQPSVVSSPRGGVFAVQQPTDSLATAQQSINSPSTEPTKTTFADLDGGQTEDEKSEWEKRKEQSTAAYEERQKQTALRKQEATARKAQPKQMTRLDPDATDAWQKRQELTALRKGLAAGDPTALQLVANLQADETDDPWVAQRKQGLIEWAARLQG